MRQRAKFVVLNIWFILVLGLLLHTSRNPQLFDKYSLKYFTVLVVVALLLIPLLKITSFIFTNSIHTVRRKKYYFSSIRKIVVLALIIIELLLPIEFYLRYKYRNFEQNSYQYNINNFHPFLQSQLEKGEDIHVNSFGFRGDEIALKKPTGTFRIVVLGGSTVLNREVSFEKNATRLLEKELGKQYPKRKIEVINAGKDGYNSEHTLIQYLFNIKDFSPDLIVVWQGINDFYLSCTPSDNEYGDFKRDYSHAFGPLMRMALNYFRPQPIISLKLVSFDFLLKHLRDNLYSDVVSYYKGKAEDSFANDYRKGGANYAKVDSFPSLTVYQRNLDSLIKAAKSDGVQILIGDQANLYKERVSVEESKRLIFPNLVCKKGGKFYGMESIRNGIQQFNSAAKKVADENDVPFIDFDKGIPKNLEYFLDSVHYTEKGNSLVALLLLNAIKEHHFVDQSYEN